MTEPINDLCLRLGSEPEPDAQSYQVGGAHYRDMAIQPATYVIRNAIGWAEGEVIKYVSRWRRKNGIEDLRKARHVLLLLIQSHEAAEAAGEE